MKHAKFVKQTILLLSTFLTLNIYSMVTMVARSTNCRMTRSLLQTRPFLQKKLSQGTLNICFKREASESLEKENRNKEDPVDHGFFETAALIKSKQEKEDKEARVVLDKKNRVVLDEAHGIFEDVDSIQNDLNIQSEACKRYCSYSARHLRPNFRNKSLLHPGLFQKKSMCEKDFHDPYEKQRRIYLERKFLSLCAGKSFDEPWSYDPKNERRNFTDEEHKLMRDPEIRKCSEKCVAQYALAKRAIYYMNNPEKTYWRDDNQDPFVAALFLECLLNK